MVTSFLKSTFIFVFLFLIISCGGSDNPQETPLPAPIIVPANNAPNANAGEDQVVEEGATVFLESLSEDSDGNILSVEWTQTSGISLEITNANSDISSFVAPDVDSEEIVVFQLVVTDDDGANDMDEVSITIEPIIEPVVENWSVPSLRVENKKFFFSWKDTPDSTHYKLFENADGNSQFIQVGSDIEQGTQMIEITVPLFERHNAQYILKTCNQNECIDSNILLVEGNLVEGIVDIIGSNTEEGDRLGYAVSLSHDGNTLAVGAYEEDSGSRGINGDEADNSESWSGAVYVYQRSSNGWIQEAYIKSSNSEFNDNFGVAVAISGDGKTLAVGAQDEDSGADGVDSDQDDSSEQGTGAAYIFVKEAGEWTQQAYIKASDSRRYNYFGTTIALNEDGNTLAVGAPQENSNMTTINGDRENQFNPPIYDSGAVYLFRRDAGSWTEQAHFKSSDTKKEGFFGDAIDLSNSGNTLVVGARRHSIEGVGGDSGAVYVFEFNNDSWSQDNRLTGSYSGGGDQFGQSVSISGDGNTIAVGARGDSSGATGVNPGSVTDYGTYDYAGAAYVFVRSGASWTQQAYIKAENTEANDYFGMSISLSENGNTLAVGANFEDSGIAGVDADQFDNSESHAGAVYTYKRSNQQWHQTSYLKSTAPKMTDEFGIDLQLSGDGLTLIVGANNANNFAGAAFVY